MRDSAGNSSDSACRTARNRREPAVPTSPRKAVPPRRPPSPKPSHPRLRRGANKADLRRDFFHAPFGKFGDQRFIRKRSRGNKINQSIDECFLYRKFRNLIASRTPNLLLTGACIPRRGEDSCPSSTPTRQKADKPPRRRLLPVSRSASADNVSRLQISVLA